MRNLKITRKKLFWLISLILLVGLFLFAFDSRLKTVHYTVKSDKITAPLCIALVTDLHSCRYGNDQKQLIDAVTARSPDLILLGGDIFDDELPHDNARIFLTAIARQFPCYYVTGNHEFWSGEAPEMVALVRSLGVTALSGDRETLTVNGNVINLCGIDDQDAPVYVPGHTSSAEQLRLLAPVFDHNTYTILLAHRPEQVDRNDNYLQYPFDLILSGHTHSGQWRVPGMIDGLWAPNQGKFPAYTGGLYHFEHTKLIISRGLARESTRIPRIFNRPELVIVTLAPAT